MSKSNALTPILTRPSFSLNRRGIDGPEALTFGDTKKEALQEMEDALLVALSGYEDEGREIPEPSEPGSDQSLALISLSE
jgi:hypothetical protein